MNKKNAARKSTSLGILVMLMLATVGLLALSVPASAHVCKSEDHSGCASHSCPDDGDVHKHRHDVHFWRDHGCASSPSCNSDVVDVEGEVPVECNGVDVYTPAPGEIVPVDPFQ